MSIYKIRSLMLSYCKWLATCGSVGYTPLFPGTSASLLVGVPLLLIWKLVRWSIYSELIALLGMTGIAIFIINRALLLLPFAGKDPSQIVLDEVIGLLWTFAGLGLVTRLSFASIVMGFVFFRICDIWKPWPILHVERFPGAYGIILDDCLAAFYAQCILRLWIS